MNMNKPQKKTIEVVNLLDALEYLDKISPGIRKRMAKKLQISKGSFMPMPYPYWRDEQVEREHHGDQYIDDLLLIEKEFPELSEKTIALVDW